MNSKELHGQAAVVTGSSSGIGRAIALELAAAGADILVHAKSNRQGAEQTAEEIRKLGVNAATVCVDLADPQQHEALIQAAWGWREDVSIWINNAGADVLTGEPAKWSFERKLEHLWKVDVTASIRLSRLAGAKMWEREEGEGERTSSILNIGWDQSEHGMAGDSGELFSAIKGAVTAFSKSLAQSLAPRVRVNCVAPGWIKTAWGDQASEYWQQRACQESLLRRWGLPEDIAAAAKYLVSPAAGFVTGQVLAVNGGFHRSCSS